MKNYCTQTDLENYFPELASYLWQGETNFSNFLTGAEEKVGLDLKNKGYDLRQLQTKLFLLDETDFNTGEDVTESFEDKANRLRLVYTSNREADGNVFILQGSDDNSTWNDVETFTLSESGEHSSTFIDAYKYYRISYDFIESLTIKIFLVETNYDILFCYKTLELILMNASKDQNDQWWIKMLYFRELYNEQLNSMVISIDTDDSETIEDEEAKSFTNAVKYLR